MSRLGLAVACVCAFAFGSKSQADFIVPAVAGTVGDFFETPSHVRTDWVMPSSLLHPRLNDNAYGILEFRLSEFASYPGGAWLQLYPLSLTGHATVELSVSKGDGQLTLDDFALGQSFLTYHAGFSSGNFSHLH